MAYYRTCPICKATLDPGERCDCEERKGDRMDTQPLAKDIQIVYYWWSGQLYEYGCWWL